MPAQPAIAGCPLSCIVVNVNGLRNRTKRRTLFQRLRTLRPCIILLCETHSRDDAETLAWTQEGAGPGLPWEGHAFWHHGTSSSRGVAILISSAVPISQPSLAHQDREGRLLSVSFKSEEGFPWEIMAVYAPCEPQNRAPFFQGPFAQACAHTAPGTARIIAGDWNCVTSPADFFSPHPNPQQNSRLIGGAELQGVQTMYGLTDVWRVLHPQAVEFTRVTQSPQYASFGRTTRWLVSQELLDESWEASCVHMPGQLPGDHAPIHLRLNPPGEPILERPAWNLPPSLLASSEYLNMMEAHLQAHCTLAPPGCTAMEFWDYIKVSIRAATLDFQCTRRSHQHGDRQQLLHSVWYHKQQLLDHPSSLPYAAAYATAVRALQEHDTQAVSQTALTLDALWETYGEQGTMWFHRLGRSPAAAQPFRMVKDPSGGPPASLATPAGFAQAKHLLADFFDGSNPTGLFHPAVVDLPSQDELLAAIDCTLDDEAQKTCRGPTLDGTLTGECIKAALATAPKGKRPGCDGIPYEFYQRFWSLLAGPMVAAFNEAFLSPAASPELSELCRTGLIVLLHKGGGKPRDDPDSYRPITLLNCDVKLVAKVLVSRLGPPLDTVIDGTQTAFVPGRWIGDNVLFHLEELDYVTDTNASACLVGLDYNKAYDRVNRGWLHRCMEALGLPSEAQRWVSLLLQGTRAQVIVNGALSRAFAVPAGCAQGSPLSPLLYVIAAQPLAARCRQLQAQGLVGPILLPDGTPAPPLHQHADDTTLHTSTVSGAQVLLEQAVRPFCKASGAALNIAKSWGLTLGSHPPIVGTHAATGIPFQSSLDHIRHLGIPLTTGDKEAAASALYGKKLKSVCARIRHWARHRLSLVGRLHVAKQVLASTIAYHATFLAPPPAQLAAISRALSGYVISGGLLDEENTSPLRHRPSRYVTSLPRDMGGLALVDLEAFGHALRAKIPALLLHPRRCAWKPLMSAAFARACPGLGIRVLVQQTRCYGAAAAEGSLGARHGSYMHSFKQLGLHRRLSHHTMSREQVALESLVGNHSVANTEGHAFKSPSQLPPSLRHLHTLGQVPLHDLHLLKLPEVWPSVFMTPTQCQWQVDPTSTWVRYVEQTGALQHFRVLPDARLLPSPHAPAPPPITWVPACVLACPSPQLRAQDSPPRYLAGPWSSIAVDPSVWCFGPDPVLFYTVRASTARIIQWQCHHAPGWVSGCGIRPKLWGSGMGGARPDAVSSMEARQKRRFEEAFGAAGSSGSRLREADLAPLYHASWFDPSPPRLHVRQRVAERDATLTQQREEQQARTATILYPELDDTLDPLEQDGVLLAARPAWSHAWLRAHLPSMPRESRVFAWTLLHAALPCGGARVKYCPPGHPALSDCYCRAPCCTSASPRPVETLQHMFLECPVGKVAMQWVCGLWQRIDPGPAPLFAASVLLADDASVWRPSQHIKGLQALWTLLRVTMLKRIWLTRQACAHSDNTGGPFTATRVVASFVTEVTALLRHDWLRVHGDLPSSSGVCPTWFRGRRQRGVSEDDFVARWCRNAVLAQVLQPPPAGSSPLQVQLSLASVPSVALV